MNKNLLQKIVLCIAGLVLMLLISACGGIVNGTTTLTGSISSIDSANHVVMIQVNGQLITVKGLNDQELAALSGQVGKTYTLQVTQNSDSSYSINANTTPEADGNSPDTHETPSANETPGTSSNTNEPSGVSEKTAGSVQFIGNVRGVSNRSIVVSMPDGSTLSMSIVPGQTDMSDFNGSLPRVGQTVKVEATANSTGNFTATKLGMADSSDDASKVTYEGITTSAVGADTVLHFQIGNKSFGFSIASNADLGDFNNNARSIGNNFRVKVEVQFQGTNGIVTDISNPNN